MTKRLIGVLLAAFVLVPFVTGMSGKKEKQYDRALAKPELLSEALPVLEFPVVSIENVPETVRVGDTFTVNVVLDLRDFGSAGHELSVVFTSGLLSVIDTEELGAPPHEFNLSPGVRSVSNEFGLVSQFEAGSFGAVATGERFVIGRITFLAIDDGKAGISPLFNTGGAVLDDQDLARSIPGVIFESVHLQVRR